MVLFIRKFSPRGRHHHYQYHLSHRCTSFQYKTMLSQRPSLPPLTSFTPFLHLLAPPPLHFLLTSFSLSIPPSTLSYFLSSSLPSPLHHLLFLTSLLYTPISHPSLSLLLPFPPYPPPFPPPLPCLLFLPPLSYRPSCFPSLSTPPSISPTNFPLPPSLSPIFSTPHPHFPTLSPPRYAVRVTPLSRTRLSRKVHNHIRGRLRHAYMLFISYLKVLPSLTCLADIHLLLCG